MDKLYFIYRVDCEPLAAKSPMCGGPSSWAVSERAILRYAEIFRARGMLHGLSFDVTGTRVDRGDGAG
ncbi:MAG: hypothetical protein FJ279_02980 [Planctomycetes bacterium]|nr:hypothetical protein [Planctomycetota bacterium]MBM4082300.1 hypothetical protein [Planctomycetota bacterium]